MGFIVTDGNKGALSIPDGDISVCTRFVLCAHLQEAGDLGVAAKLVQLCVYCACREIAFSRTAGT